MKSTKLAIIIPYFKLNYFRKTLLSLSAQTCADFNVYIGNDASLENPESTLAEFKDKITFTYKKFHSNLGSSSLTKQWERCLELMQGEEWFIILGDDDQLSENTVEEFYRVINDANNVNYTVLRLQRQIIDEDGKEVKKITSYTDLESTTDFLYKRSLNLVGSSLGEYIFRKQDYKRFGIRGFDKAFYADNMMVIEYANFGVLKNIQNAYALIRISPQSLSGDINNQNNIRNAGVQFYTEIVQNYSKHFTRKQLFLFLNIILAGLKTEKRQFSRLKFVRNCLFKIGFIHTCRMIITMIKYDFRNSSRI